MNAMNAKQLKKCNDLIRVRHIEMIDLKCIDLTGYLHHITLPVYPNILEKLVHEGVGFDGSSYGFRKVENSDMVLVPDLATATIDPFRTALRNSSATPTMQSIRPISMMISGMKLLSC